MNTITTLTGHPKAQAKVYKYGNGVIRLMSYKTWVAELTADGWLTIPRLYSVTTRKHIVAFCKEYAGIDFATIKLLVTNHYKYNINTGEIQDA